MLSERRVLQKQARKEKKDNGVVFSFVFGRARDAISKIGSHIINYEIVAMSFSQAYWLTLLRQ